MCSVTKPEVATEDYEREHQNLDSTGLNSVGKRTLLFLLKLMLGKKKIRKKKMISS